jgi:hypothetical protein
MRCTITSTLPDRIQNPNENDLMGGALQTLLDSIIDYAGLFPPAGLDMGAAVSNYAKYRTGTYAWMLGRFIVPVAQVREFESAVRQHVPVSESGEPPWRLSVLAGPDIESDLVAIAYFNSENRRPADVAPSRAAGDGASGQREGGRRFAIDTIELNSTHADEIAAAMRQVPPELCACFEVPVSSDESMLAIARSAGARVKVRTGGLTPTVIPTCSELAEFIARCAAVGVPFKATAGLHHPIRSVQRLTYADDSPRGTMHGFLNVFLAAAGVRAGMSPDEAEQLLEETSPQAIQFDELGASWRQHRWTNDQLQATRHEFAISFGSCSFQEPIDDLKGIGLL